MSLESSGGNSWLLTLRSPQERERSDEELGRTLQHYKNKTVLLWTTQKFWMRHCLWKRLCRYHQTSWSLSVWTWRLNATINIFSASTIVAKSSQQKVLRNGYEQKYEWSIKKTWGNVRGGVSKILQVLARARTTARASWDGGLARSVAPVVFNASVLK